jgi:phosphoserine phosphatase
VSGGLGLYLRPWAAGQGLEVLCSELEVRDGRCTGRFAGSQCVAAEKAGRVCHHIDLAAYAQVHAYGDTPEDAELLALADHRIYRGRSLGAPAGR